jgi:hypothetical protein
VKWSPESDFFVKFTTSDFMKIFLLLSSFVGIQTEGWSNLMAFSQGWTRGKSAVMNVVRYSKPEGSNNFYRKGNCDRRGEG